MRQLDRNWDISNSDYKRFADLCNEMHRRRVVEVARVRETVSVVRFLTPSSRTPDGRQLEGRPDIAPDFDRTSRRRDYDDYDRRRGRDDDHYRRSRDDHYDDDRGYRGGRARDDEMRGRAERQQSFDRRRDSDEVMRDSNANVDEQEARNADTNQEAADEPSGAPADAAVAGEATEGKTEPTASDEVEQEKKAPTVDGQKDSASNTTADDHKESVPVAKAEAMVETEKGSDGSSVKGEAKLEETVANVVKDDVMANHSTEDTKMEPTEVKGEETAADVGKDTEMESAVKKEPDTVQNEASTNNDTVMNDDGAGGVSNANNVGSMSNGEAGSTKPEANGISAVESKAEPLAVEEVKKANAAAVEEGQMEKAQ